MTHPSPGDRVAAVEQRLAQAPVAPGQLRIGRQPYLERIDGLVYGVNPRHGFFRDGLFLHPELRFQMAFPAQWQRQNLAQAVIAVSPQQNAVIQLSLSRDGSPETAAQRFAAQQGVQPGQSSRQNINGLPAVTVSFRAQTQQQVVQGLAAFISHGGRVYQIVSYSPVGIYGNFDRTFQQSIGSFAPNNDPQVLNIQPNRVRIVRTTESMTLAQFNQRFPSVIPIEELTVLNQVEGPQTVIPGGSLVKRVVGG
jgi:predicted Zn-dependent protease